MEPITAPPKAFPVSRKEELRVEAARHGISMSALVRIDLIAGLERHEGMDEGGHPRSRQDEEQRSPHPPYPRVRPVHEGIPAPVAVLAGW